METEKISKKSRTVPKKIESGDSLVPSGFVGYLEKLKNERGFGFFLKGAHYEVDYCGKKTYLAGLQCMNDFVMCKNEMGDPFGLSLLWPDLTP